MRRASAGALVLVMLLALSACGCGGAGSGSSRKPVVLATTTSTEDSGILEEFIRRFESGNRDYKVKPIAVGSGAALFMGSNGDADIMLTHEPRAEKEFVEQGNAESQFKLMHNGFIIIGPASDPARVKGMKDGAAAMKAIAGSGAGFLSRADASGTNAMEMTLWERAGVNPAGQPWYLESGQGMGETIRIADEKRVYTISDKATFIVMSPYIELVNMVEGDPTMLNQYTVTVVNHEKFPRVNNKGAHAFADFLKEPATRSFIKQYGWPKYKKHLFYPD